MRETINIYGSGTGKRFNRPESDDSSDDDLPDSDESSGADDDTAKQAKRIKNVETSPGDPMDELNLDALSMTTPPPKEAHEREMKRIINELISKHPRSNIYKHKEMGLLAVEVLDNDGSKKILQYQLTLEKNGQYYIELLPLTFTNISEFRLVHQHEPGEVAHSTSAASPSSSSQGPSGSNDNPDEPGARRRLWDGL